MEDKYYEHFKEQLIEEIEKYLYEHDVQATISQNQISKLNLGDEVDAITIKFEDSNIAPTIYPKNIFYDFINSNISIKDFVEKQMNYLVDNQQHFSFDAESITADFIKDNLFYKIANRELNKSLEDTSPCKLAVDDDLLLVPYVRVSDIAGEAGAFRLTNEMKQQVKLSDDEVYKYAMDNLNVEPFEVKNMNEIICEMMGIDDYPTDVAEVMAEDNSMYIVTNQSRINGAVAMTMPSILEEVKEKIGEDFFVIPSSIHEFIAIPESVVSDPADLTLMCKEVNRDVLKKEDFLSDNISFYDSQNLELKICNSIDELEKIQENISEKIGISRGIKL